MSDPARWRQVGDDQMRALLQHAERPRSMNEQERRQMGSRVARMAAVPAGLGVLFWIKGMALGAGLGAVAVVAGVTIQHAREPAPAVSAPIKSSAPAVISTAPQAPEPSASAPAPAASVSAAAVSAQSVSRADQLAEEVALIEQARGAIGAEPSRALELASQHAKRFPSGQLSMEREIVAIEALKAMGRASEARGRAERLLRGAKGTLYEERILHLIPELGREE